MTDRPSDLHQEDDARILVSALEVGLQFYLSRWAARVPLCLQLIRATVDETDDIDLISAALGMSPDDGHLTSVIQNRILPNQFDTYGFGEGLEGGAEEIARFDWGSGGVVLVLTDVQFTRGSANFDAIIQSWVIPIMALIMAAPPAIEGYRDFTINAQISDQIKGSTCQSAVDFKLNIWTIRRANDQLLNWSETGIDAEERRLRLCRTQFALKVLAAGPGQLDGLMGPDTETAIRSFAANRHIQLPPLGTDPDKLDTTQLRDALAQGLAARYP